MVHTWMKTLYSSYQSGIYNLAMIHIIILCLALKDVKNMQNLKHLAKNKWINSYLNQTLDNHVWANMLGWLIFMHVQLLQT